jgi:hypothetical protein
MWIAVALFFILSPGVLFTIPTGQGRFATVLAHAAVFIASLTLISVVFNTGVEGFKDKHVEGWQLGSSCGTEYCKYPKLYCLENESGVKYCSETE